MVEASPQYKDYLELRDYLVMNPDHGIIYFKRHPNQFHKVYKSQNWNPSERRLTWEEFQQYYGMITGMMTQGRTVTY